MSPEGQEGNTPAQEPAAPVQAPAGPDVFAEFAKALEAEMKSNETGWQAQMKTVEASGDAEAVAAIKAAHDKARQMEQELVRLRVENLQQRGYLNVVVTEKQEELVKSLATKLKIDEKELRQRWATTDGSKAALQMAAMELKLEQEPAKEAEEDTFDSANTSVRSGPDWANMSSDEKLRAVLTGIHKRK